MTMNERRAEIMRILTARRSITMPELARTFQVTTRTIQNDVVALTVDYPLETQQGNKERWRTSAQSVKQSNRIAHPLAGQNYELPVFAWRYHATRKRND